MQLILNDIAGTPNPRNLVLDDYIAEDFEPTVTYGVYWRWEDEPTMEFQFLGTQNVGSTLAVPFDLMGRTIRFSAIGYTKDGVPTVLDVREGVQTTYTPDPTIGILTDGGDVLTDGGDVLWNLG